MMFRAVLLIGLCFVAVSDSKSIRAVSLQSDALRSNGYSHVDGLMKIMDRFRDGKAKRSADITLRKRLSKLQGPGRGVGCPPDCSHG